MDVTARMANYIFNAEYNSLPSKVVEKTKQHILHTIATVLGGSGFPGCKSVVDMVVESGGKKESSILVYGNMVPAPSAALANSTMAHALEFCMVDDRTSLKSSVTVVPASLAAAERQGEVTGKALINSVYLGVELGVRIALAINPKPVHASTPLIGCFASAAAAGKLMGLNEEQLLDALGIAYCQLCDSGAVTASPVLTKRLKAGLTARAGMFSALLAEKGFRSSREILHGKKGYFYTYHGYEGDLEQLSGDLGKKFEILNVGMKAYPCCRQLQTSLDAALSLVNEHNIEAKDVEAVNIYGSDQGNAFKDFTMEPDLLEKYRHPKGEVDAQFSIPWGLAVAVVKRRVFIEDFTDEAVKNPEVKKIAEKVTMILDTGLRRADRIQTPTVVEIKTGNGQVFRKQVDYARGNPKNPVSMEETRENFMKCAACAAKPLSRVKIEKAINLIDNLENVADVSELARLLH